MEEAYEMEKEEIKHAREILNVFQTGPTIQGLKLRLKKDMPEMTLEEWDKFLEEQERKNVERND